MKKTTMRLFALAMLTMFSISAWAQIDVQIANDGKFDGGTIKYKDQTKPDEKGLVTVTITVIPDKGYTISSKDITVVSTYSISGSNNATRSPEIAAPLTLLGSDPEDLGKERDYKVIVASTFGVWVKEATFSNDSKGGGKKRGENATPISSFAELNAIAADGDYIITADIDASSYTTKASFTGTLTARAKEDGTFPVIKNLGCPLFTTATDATISNIMLKSVSISQAGYVGAICGTAKGTTRIYNCGILPTSLDNASSRSTVVSTSHHCGSLVGLLDDNARVINCFSYADVSAPNTNSGVAAGIVGYNNVSTTMANLKTMVMNCMFYGNITGASTMKPVYGGKVIRNAGTTGVNGYNYYRNGKDVTFDDDYANFDAYFCTLPADEEYLTRFEYYRSILNSNKKLCTWWISGTSETAPTDADVETVGIAKWVLDPSIAPYPILKKWGKYPSVINQDKTRVWDPRTEDADGTPLTPHWVNRSSAPAYHGKQLGTIKVTVKAGAKYTGTEATSSKVLLSEVVMDMDTLNHDYCYAKIQLPYYNEQFGDPSVQLPDPSADDYTSKWKQRYGGNYTDYVVTGWKITAVSEGTPGTFKGYAFASSGGVSAGAVSPDDTSGNPWEDGFNFADRNCTNKDLYSKSGRVFAQGGYYYVPEGVTGITIEAYWGKAVYLHNKEHSVDRVNVAAGADGASTAEYGYTFSPAGTLSDQFQRQTVQTTLQEAISQLTKSASLTVYDQAIVLVGNVQVKNRSESVGRDKTASNSRPFTIMSIDEDMDNEPDYCLELQFRQKTDRPAIHPVRFDFLPVPELGLAIKTNKNAYAIGVFIPQGHFEITETSFMHTTQFEYDGDVGRVESPIILNGGHFEQIVVRYCNGNKDKVSYFLLGGHFRIKRFTPGHHASNNTANATVRHCAVNVIGGDFPELYLSGIYQPGLAVRADNPHCYINGGRFGTLAGAGYEQVDGNVTFKIDHALIEKFYGGGMNGAKPVTGDIDVTINNSIVYDIFCGGPMVGEMTKPDGGTRKTVMTTAENTIFDKYFGGGNGGTSYYREQKYDNDDAWPTDWTASKYKFPEFNPLNTVSGKTTQYNKDKGYHDMFEFEVFNSSNGLNANCVARTFIQWAQFGTTITGTVTNTLTNCTIEHDFYGGGNLGTVDGDVISTLTNTHVKGSVFGGGYSAEIPRFRMHDVNNVHVPTRNNAGLIEEQGYLDYVQDGGEDRYYRWTNDKKDNKTSTNTPTYWSETDKEWKCYTPIPLAGLGEVSGNVTLIINGTTTVDHSVYGGGEESGVAGDTEVNVTSGTIGAEGSGGVEFGNVYGGGKGKAGERDAGYVKGNTVVNISQAEGKTTTIYHNVYGGGAYGSVGDFTYDSTSGMPTALAKAKTGACTVTITGGTIGTTGKENGMVFGSSRGDVATPEGTPAVDPNDRMAWVYSTQVNIGTEKTTGPHIKGSVYGSGENGHTFQNTELNIYSGTIGIPTGSPITDNNGTPEDTSDDKSYSGASYPYRGNVYGGGCGTDKYYSGAIPDGHSANDGKGDKYNPLAGIVKGNTTLNIKGGHVARNVYGAGAMGSVGTAGDAKTGKTTINVTGGRIGYDGNSDNDGCIFGAARGEYGVSTAASGLANVRQTEVSIDYTTTPAADNEEKTEKLIAGSVFGGGEAGTVKESVAVNMTGGLVLKDVYGGGALADTQTSNWDATLNENKGGWAAGKTSASAKTTINLTGGTVTEEVFGGGLGESGTEQNPAGKPAYVYGDVLVELNNGVDDDKRGCAVGQIFGCNNLNGTPKGNVQVHVHKTQRYGATRITNTDSYKTAKVKGTKTDGEYNPSSFDVKAVYGGGNMAAYDPLPTVTTGTDAEKEVSKPAATVIVDGCDLTSICYVYGGGNAASTPATSVTINGTYEIGELFGGGNGKDAVIKDGVTKPNPGANVGYKDYSEYYQEDGIWKVRDKENADTKEERLASAYVYGTGKASVNVYGGLVHRVFGGSNTKGNVRQTAVTLLDEAGGCEFCVDEAYGGGKSAEMDAEAQLLMACIPGLSAAYGGAEAADVRGNVTLNITNGTFDRVFGGNNLSGTISGSITVNVEEIGCKPVKIGELYGGGNQAAYSVYGYDSNGKAKETGDRQYADPQVNVMSFTSIGNIFGGGYGDRATMVGNPTVNVNEAYGRYYNDDVSVVGENVKTPNDYPIPSHAKGKMGAINNIFGGGNAAKVIGNATVNIGTLKDVYVVKKVSEGDPVTDYFTRNNDGTYTAATGTAADGTTYYEKKDVIGADIRGNVYGGGNNADVTGNTNVVIGKRSE